MEALQNKQDSMYIQLAQIAHDLKTPLKCINSSTDLLHSLLDKHTPGIDILIQNLRSSFEFNFSLIEDIQDIGKIADS